MHEEGTNIMEQLKLFEELTPAQEKILKKVELNLEIDRIAREANKRYREKRERELRRYSFQRIISNAK